MWLEEIILNKMKYSEITNLSLEELKQKVATEEKALENLYFAHAITPLENPMQLKHRRKLVARLNTALTTKLKA